MEKMKLVLAILFITCISSLQAQSNSVVKIASELTLLFDPLTIEYGDTMKYKYTITNVGDQALEITYPFWTGSGWTWFPKFDHKIKAKNPDFPALPLSYSFVDDDEGTVGVSLYDPHNDNVLHNVYPGDSAVVNVRDVLLPLRHRDGNNTIVVWPENLVGATVPDSLEYNVHIGTDSFSPENSSEKSISDLKIFPNPTNGFVYVLGISEIENEVSSVSIHNMNGQLVKQFNGIYEQYDVSNFPPGHYTVNFHLKNNGNFAKPLIIQK